MTTVRYNGHVLLFSKRGKAYVVTCLSHAWGRSVYTRLRLAEGVSHHLGLEVGE